MRWLLGILSGLLVCAALSPAFAAGPRIQYGPATRLTAEEIQTAVRQSPGYNEGLMGSAGLLAVNKESGGNLGIYNGSCCTGVLQVNTENLKVYGGLSGSDEDVRRAYANMSLQEQANIWVKVTNVGAGAVPSALNGMTTFDGQPVDSAFRLACVQLGTGNCRQMIASGSCSGFRDGGKTSICDMANAIRNGSPGSSSGAQPSGGGGGAQCLVEMQSSAGVRVMSGYGMRNIAQSPGWHNGLDIVNSAGEGDPLKSGISGTMTARSCSSGGLCSFVVSADKKQVVVSFHMQKFKDGYGTRQIAAGEVFGYMGKTGSPTAGVHHHLGVALEGSLVKRGVAGGPFVKTGGSGGGGNIVGGIVVGAKGKAAVEVAGELAQVGKYYFVNPETFLPSQISYSPGSTKRADNNRTMTLPPTCAASNAAFDNGSSPPQSTAMGTSSQQGAESQGTSRVTSQDFAADSAGSDDRSTALNNSRTAYSGFVQSSNEGPARDAAAMGLALSALSAAQ